MDMIVCINNSKHVQTEFHDFIVLVLKLSHSHAAFIACNMYESWESELYI